MDETQFLFSWTSRLTIQVDSKETYQGKVVKRDTIGIRKITSWRMIETYWKGRLGPMLSELWMAREGVLSHSLGMEKFYMSVP